MGLFSAAGLLLPVLGRLRRRFRIGMLAAVPAAMASQARGC